VLAKVSGEGAVKGAGEGRWRRCCEVVKLPGKKFQEFLEEVTQLNQAPAITDSETRHLSPLVPLQAHCLRLALSAGLS
jgi:hypothetical protein